MALNWRLRRQLLYIGIPILLVVLIASYLIYASLSQPTCYDGIQNQGERGIDCEGPCPQVCLERVSNLDLIYARAIMTQPGVYNLVARIENYNQDLALHNQQVIFKLYSDQGELIGEHSGNFDIRPAFTTLAFIGPVQLNTEPHQVVLEFGELDWQITSISNPFLEVISQSLTNPITAPRLEVRLRNNELDAFRQVPTVAVIEDNHNNLIATSQTFIDLPDLRETSAVFTWPRPFPQVLQECQWPLDSVVITEASLEPDQTNPLQAILTQENANLVATLTYSWEAQEDDPDHLDQVIDAALSALLNNRSQERKNAIVLFFDQSDDQDIDFSALNARALGMANSFDVNLHTVVLGADFNISEFSSQITEPAQLEQIKNQLSAGTCEVSSYSVEVFPQPPLR